MGVANRELVVDGHTSEEDHPLMRELASQLHHHQIGVLRFARGVTREELEDLLGAIAPAVGRSAEPLGTRPESVINRWPHITLHPMAFDRLALAGDGADLDVREAARRQRVDRHPVLVQPGGQADRAGEVEPPYAAGEPGIAVAVEPAQQRRGRGVPHGRDDQVVRRFGVETEEHGLEQRGIGVHGGAGG